MISEDIFRLALQHLMLVAVSTGLSVVVGVPTGLLLTHSTRLARLVLGAANILQTVPSLALFGLLIPLPLLGGIGTRTALVALVLYALLPIVRNSYTGVRSLDPALSETAIALGMTNWQKLRLVEVPLALPVIFAGIRISAVVSVGTATIAAAIGAGGLGELIFRGVAMVDNRLILAGALPAAALALIIDTVLHRIEGRLTRVRRLMVQR